ncbi:MAG TPA: nuclease-related domain-containing protein [Solirubrobacteraceae bacterium]|nr:nuclease-related domain-containing protein [Solirubrobacteraceae bacterium]
MSYGDEDDAGIAGRSARREFERRSDRRRLEASARPRLLTALLGPSRQHKRRAAEDRKWQIGARGEEILAESLTRRCPEAILLHDRRLPGGRSNIDHIAIAPSGVYVIDTKRHRGKIQVQRPLFGPPKLRIAGRDRTKLIVGLHTQVAVVEAALGALAADVPVHGCLCFVAPEGLLADVGLPLLRTLEIDGCQIYYPRKLARRLNRAGSLSVERALAIRAELSRSLPAA